MQDLKQLGQLGGSVDTLVEVDILRGENHDMLSDHAVYSGLVRAALEGKINALVAGPNCRTRSLLRHIPIPGKPEAPRRWGGEEFGVVDATEDELKSCMMISLCGAACFST